MELSLALLSIPTSIVISLWLLWDYFPSRSERFILFAVLTTFWVHLLLGPIRR